MFVSKKKRSVSFCYIPPKCTRVFFSLINCICFHCVARIQARIKVKTVMTEECTKEEDTFLDVCSYLHGHGGHPEIFALIHRPQALCRHIIAPLLGPIQASCVNDDLKWIGIRVNVKEVKSALEKVSQRRVCECQWLWGNWKGTGICECKSLNMCFSRLEQYVKLLLNLKHMLEITVQFV